MTLVLRSGDRHWAMQGHGRIRTCDVIFEVRSKKHSDSVRSLPSMQKLYTLRGVSAVCEDLRVNAGLPVCRTSVRLMQLGETGVYATARILKVDDSSSVAAFI
jgi:hypothetical protein